MPDPAPVPDRYLCRMGWSHITPDGWISLSHSYKRNISGRVIATEADPAWLRDIELAQPLNAALQESENRTNSV